MIIIKYITLHITPLPPPYFGRKQRHTPLVFERQFVPSWHARWLYSPLLDWLIGYLWADMCLICIMIHSPPRDVAMGVHGGGRTPNNGSCTPKKEGKDVEKESRTSKNGPLHPQNDGPRLSRGSNQGPFAWQADTLPPAPQTPLHLNFRHKPKRIESTHLTMNDDYNS